MDRTSLRAAQPALQDSRDFLRLDGRILDQPFQSGQQRRRDLLGQVFRRKFRDLGSQRARDPHEGSPLVLVGVVR